MLIDHVLCIYDKFGGLFDWGRQKQMQKWNSKHYPTDHVTISEPPNTLNDVLGGERNLSELEFVRIRFLPLFEEIGICQNWNLSELEFVRIHFLPLFEEIGICKNWNL